MGAPDSGVTWASRVRGSGMGPCIAAFPASFSGHVEVLKPNALLGRFEQVWD